MSVTDRGIVRQYKLNETSGNTGYCSVSAYNITFNGTLGQAYNWDASGRVGRCVFIDKANYYTVNHGFNLVTFNGDFTISAWVNMSLTAEARLVVGSYIDALCGMFYPGDNVQGIGVAIAGVGYNLDSGFDFSSGTWYHLCARRVGDKLDYWVDGVKKINNRTCSTEPMILYRLGGVGYPLEESFLFQGKMDALRFYNLGLSDDEVADLAAESTANETDIYPYRANSVVASDNGNFPIDIEVSNGYSVPAAEDPWYPVDVDECYSAGVCDQPLLDVTVIGVPNVQSTGLCDELTLEVEYAYPFGSAALTQAPQTTQAEGGGVAEIAQELQEISASGYLAQAGSAALQTADQAVYGEGNYTGDLEMDRQTMAATGYPDQVGEFSARMLAQVLSGEAYAPHSGDAALRVLPQLLSAAGSSSSFGSGECLMAPQRVAAVGMVGVAGDGVLEMLPQVLAGSGGLDGYGEGDLVMDPQLVEAVGGVPSRFTNYILAYPSRT